MLPAPLWLALVRAMLVVDDGTRITQLSLHVGRQRNENTAFLALSEQIHAYVEKQY